MKKNESESLVKAAKRSHNVLTRIEYLRKAAENALADNPEKALKLIEEANKETELLDDGMEQRLINNLCAARGLLMLDKLRESQFLIEDGWKYIENSGNNSLRMKYALEKAHILEHRGDYTAALKILEEEVPLYYEFESEADRMNFLSKKGHIMLQKGMLAEAEELLNEGLAMAEKASDYQLKIDFIICLGMLNVERGNPAEAVKYYRTALSFVRKEDAMKIGTGWLYNNTSVPYFMLADFSMAEQMMRKALAVFEHAKHQHGIASVTLNLGGLYLQRGEIAEALPLLFTAYSMTKELGLVHAAIQTGNNIGIALTEAGDFAGAERQLHETLALAQDHDFRILESAILNSLGKHYGDRGDYETAIEYFGNSLLSARETADARAEGVSQINIAQAWQKLGLNERALPYFFFAMNSFITTGDKFHQTICYCGISEAFLALGNFDAAKDNAEQARELSLTIGNSPILKKHVEGALANTFEKIGETEKAFQHYKFAVEAGYEQQSKELVSKVVSVRIGQERDATQRNTSDLEQEIHRLVNEVEELRSKLREQTLKNVQKQQALDTAAGILNEAAVHYEKKTMPKLKEVISILQSADGKGAVWHAYEQELERQSPDFMKRLLMSYPTLTRSEIRICSLLAIQMSTKNIAAMLYLDKKTVDKHRQNIRKKMRISPSDDLALHIAMLRE